MKKWNNRTEVIFSHQPAQIQIDSVSVLQLRGWDICCRTSTAVNRLGRALKLSHTLAVSQFRGSILPSAITSQHHTKAVSIQRLLQILPTNAACFSLFLEDTRLRSFTAINCPRFIARSKRRKNCVFFREQTESFITVRGQNQHLFTGQNIQPWLDGSKAIIKNK